MAFEIQQSAVLMLVVFITTMPIIAVVAKVLAAWLEQRSENTSTN